MVTPGRTRKKQGDITVVVPDGATERWADNWCITKDAPDPVAAHAWINNMLDPNVAEGEIEYHNYPIPIAKMWALPKAKVLEDKVSWTSKLIVMQPFFYSEKSKFEDLTEAQLAAAGLDNDIANFTTTVDVDWENIFTTQITKVISVNLYLRWIYDKYDNSVPPKLDGNGDIVNAADVSAAVRKAGQFKQTLALGMSYKF